MRRYRSINPVKIEVKFRFGIDPTPAELIRRDQMFVAVAPDRMSCIDNNECIDKKHLVLMDPVDGFGEYDPDDPDSIRARYGDEVTIVIDAYPWRQLSAEIDIDENKCPNVVKKYEYVQATCAGESGFADDVVEIQKAMKPFHIQYRNNCVFIALPDEVSPGTWIVVNDIMSHKDDIRYMSDEEFKSQYIPFDLNECE